VVGWFERRVDKKKTALGFFFLFSEPPWRWASLRELSGGDFNHLPRTSTSLDIIRLEKISNAGNLINPHQFNASPHAPFIFPPLLIVQFVSHASHAIFAQYSFLDLADFGDLSEKFKKSRALRIERNTTVFFLCRPFASPSSDTFICGFTRCSSCRHLVFIPPIPGGAVNYGLSDFVFVYQTRLRQFDVITLSVNDQASHCLQFCEWNVHYLPYSSYQLIENI
jgi:hypothetical protein